MGLRNGVELCHAVAGGVTVGNRLGFDNGGLLGKWSIESTMDNQTMGDARHCC